MKYDIVQSSAQPYNIGFLNTICTLYNILIGIILQYW